MKLFSIDLETTGVDPINDQILEFGAVYLDTETKQSSEFRRIIHRDRIAGNPIAIEMNADLILELAEALRNPGMLENEKFCHEDDLYSEFAAFVRPIVPEGSINVVGKNFAAFDLNFLLELDCSWNKLIRRRILDPAMYFTEPFNEKMPNLTECLSMIGLEPTNLHTALGDCHDVLRLMCYSWDVRGVYPVIDEIITATELSTKSLQQMAT